MTAKHTLQALAVYKALSDETRLKIALKLNDVGECPTSVCSKSLDLTQPTISHHMKVLLEAGVIIDTKEGTSKKYTLNTKHLTALGISLDK
jgi:ArsR family transcriptional regulator, arsenate/arsenite/antimonite-responsive transcriptional repressor